MVRNFLQPLYASKQGHDFYQPHQKQKVPNMLQKLQSHATTMSDLPEKHSGIWVGRNSRVILAGSQQSTQCEVEIHACSAILTISSQAFSQILGVRQTESAPRKTIAVLKCKSQLKAELPGRPMPLPGMSNRTVCQRV